jgi:hypothetical protein
MYSSSDLYLIFALISLLSFHYSPVHLISSSQLFNPQHISTLSPSSFERFFKYHQNEVQSPHRLVYCRRRDRSSHHRTNRSTTWRRDLQPAILHRSLLLDADDPAANAKCSCENIPRGLDRLCAIACPNLKLIQPNLSVAADCMIDNPPTLSQLSCVLTLESTGVGSRSSQPPA